MTAWLFSEMVVQYYIPIISAGEFDLNIGEV